MAHKFRLLASALAITLGVAFMTGTLVLGDTIQHTFDGLFASVYQGTDAVVRSTTTLEQPDGGPAQRQSLPDSLIATVRSTPGVAAADGSTQGYAQLVGHDGKAIGNPNNGPPTLGLSWGAHASLNPFHIASGRAPERAGEVVIDRQTATENHFGLGQSVDVLTDHGRSTQHIVGIAKFGQEDSLLGATVALFDPTSAARLVGQPGTVTSIWVEAKPGVSQHAVVAALDQHLPAHVEAITGAKATQESEDQIHQGLSFFTTFLLAFAVIALFVGSFIIYNTFSILVAQRTREMALLRAVGASRRQVLGSVLVEATVMGTLSAVLGLGFGVLFAVGLKALLGAVGFGVPASGTVIALHSIVTAFVAGLGVTLVVALVPARRAARIAPIAALRSTAIDRTGSSMARAVAGLLVLAGGVAALFAGLFGHLDNGVAVVGGGALLTFIGVAVLGPVLAGPLTRVIGAPIAAVKGVTGRLARENAMRNPRRTSSTAAALMIGVGLMAFFSIFAASARTSIDHTIDTQFHGDYFVDSGQHGNAGLPPTIVQQARALPGVTTVLPARLGDVELAGSNEQLPGVDVGPLPKLGDLDVRQGTLAALGADQIAVSDKFATSNHLRLGSSVSARFLDTGPTHLTVAAIYHDADLMGPAFVSTAGFEAHYHSDRVSQLYLMTTPAARAQVKGELDHLLAPYPTATVEDVAQFKADQASGINALLGLIYVLLALAVVIALIGIVNTLALSILERTHELGVLRAVGMSRRQTRSLVRWEAVMTSLLGTFLGLGIGLFFGWSVVRALHDDGITQLAIPVGQLLAVIGVAAVAGVVAAILPARRAARLDVLGAIATA
jgi:putative ABC transport system permease protein